LRMSWLSGIDDSAVSNLAMARLNRRSATRSTQHATRNTQHATRNTQHATRNTQHAPSHTHHRTRAQNREEEERHLGVPRVSLGWWRSDQSGCRR
jgi:hypothetical protein